MLVLNLIKYAGKGVLLFLFGFIFFFSLSSQNPLIIDHQHCSLENLPPNWIDSAKVKLNIGYGHTSHGSQITSGMNALESYFTDGTFDWSHSGGEGKLHLFEGDGYGNAYLDHDCGYTPWSGETREYLDDFPECNVIIWSWCGQVNGVNLQSHYFEPMSQLEVDYPEVKFIYMTGHLEGQGPDGSLFHANQEIRDYCNDNNKILFDFADIEKFDPEGEINYQEYYANDACNYNDPDGGTGNWATEWLESNPEDELTAISQHCSSCAHSQPLNCVRKGIAVWHLWTRLAGWDGILSKTTESNQERTFIYPNPADDHLYVKDLKKGSQLFIKSLQGNTLKSIRADQISLKLNIASLAKGIYLLEINNEGKFHSVNKFIKL